MCDLPSKVRKVRGGTASVGVFLYVTGSRARVSHLGQGIAKYFALKYHLRD